MHYAWIILICCCLVEVGSLGLINCAGLYVAPVCASLGVSTADFSLYLSIQMISIAATATLCGAVIQKIGIKRALCLGAVMTAVLFLCMGRASSIVHFYVVGALLGPALNLFMMLPVPMLITNWFAEKQGFAMGIAMMCSAIGGAVFSIVLSRIIEVYSWRAGYLSMGVAAFVFTVPWLLLFLKNTPEEKNCAPYGRKQQPVEGAGQPEGESGIDAKQALKMPAFWLVMVFAGLVVYVCNYVTYLSAYGTSKGLSVVASGGLVSAAMLGNMVGSLALGHLVDRIGAKKTTCISGAIIIGAIALLLLGNQNMVLLLAAAMVFGLSSSMYSTMIPLFVENTFGKKDYGTIYSYVVTGMMILNAIGLFLIGTLYDVTQGYEVGLLTAVGSYVAVILLAVYILRKKYY